MKKKIVLIDGHSILNRAFYGVPDLTNSKGLHTNAIYGFINIMLKILGEENADYLAVAFDVNEPTFRHKRYVEYKGTRKPMPPELREQVPVIQEVLAAMQIPIVKKGGYEADDILGTIARRAEAEGMEVSLVSGDRDLLQLASEHILIRIPKTKRGGTEIENYRTQEVIDKYGITPAQVIDMKGLMGDSADNIPGVPGVGEKTAGRILAAFPTIEDAYEHIEEVEPKRARELLRTHKDLAFLSKELATIKTDCEINFSFEEAECKDIFTEEAFGWIKKLELKSLEKRFDAKTASFAMKQEADFAVIEKASELQAIVKEIEEKQIKQIAVGFLGDTWSNEGAKKKKEHKEASQLTFVFDDEDCFIEEEKKAADYAFYGMSITFAEKETKTYCIFCNEKLPAEEILSWYQKVEGVVSTVLLSDWKNVMHLTTPVEVLSKDRIPTLQQAFADATVEDTMQLSKKIFDVSLAAYLLNPLNDSYQVEDVARDYLEMTIPSYTDLFGKETLSALWEEPSYKEYRKSPKKSAEQEDFKKMVTYLGNLSFVPFLAGELLLRSLEEQGMLSVMTDIEMPTAYYLYCMECAGVHVDGMELKEIGKLLEEKIHALEGDIYDLAGEEFNINSPKQLGVILFEKMGLPFAKKTKTGYSTSADILEKLEPYDPIIGKILEYRQVSKLKSTYADGLSVFIDRDERIHGKFNQMITATGRISSTEPNLQNIPIRMELGQEIRKVFKPREGCVFLDADYSQIELRVLAHMSGDEELIQAYRNNQDIHRSTASKVFHTPFDEVTPLQRRNAKAVNFGIVYGISSFGLSQDLHISKKEAQEYIDAYFAMYPAVKAFIDRLVEDAKTSGYATTLFGRKRPVKELSSSNFMQRSFGERIAMNSPIQGTAADIIKIAMIRVSNRLREENLEARVVLQVHDELLVEVPVAEKEKVKTILQEEMQGAVLLSVPLVVEVLEGKDWKEAH